MKTDFLKNSKLLITGAGGFVGNAVLDRVKDLNDIIILTPTKANLDLRIQADVDKYFADNKPDYVIHLAGKVGGIMANKMSPGDFYYDNIMIGTNVMESSRKNGVKKVVALAAGCGYPADLEAPFSEDNFYDGLQDVNSVGYSMAKKMLCIQSDAYRSQYNFNSTILLPANLYGPHDNFDLTTSHVVPALIRKTIEAIKNNKKELVVWGSGNATREFLYVDDVATVIFESLRPEIGSGPFNLGTGVETSVKELVEIINKICNSNLKIVWDSSKPDGQKRRYYNMTKLKEAIGYIPNTSLFEGLTKTINWYKMNHS